MSETLMKLYVHEFGFFLGPLSWSAHRILLDREDLGLSLLLCPRRCLGKETKNAPSVLRHIKSYFINIFLNNFLYLCSRNSAT
jgi:hypothetical protein